MNRGNKCDYKKQINEKLLDNSVSEIIIILVSNPKFASMMQDKVNMDICLGNSKHVKCVALIKKCGE